MYIKLNPSTLSVELQLRRISNDLSKMRRKLFPKSELREVQYALLRDNRRHQA